MINAVGRDIPDYLLANGKEVYHGKNYMDGQPLKKATPTTVRHEKPQADKLCASIREAAEKCGAHDGMTFSFHTEFRNGDYVAAMVCKVLVEEMGLKDLHVAATSLGSAQDIFADYMERGIIVEAQTSGVRGRIGEVISAGKLKNPAIIRSHGGRPRAVEAGEVHIDIAFLAAATSDCCGNAKGTGGKDINFMVIHRGAVIQFSKHIAPKVVTPEQNPDADAWKFGYRQVGVADVYENKTAGIYVHHKA